MTDPTLRLAVSLLLTTGIFAAAGHAQDDARDLEKVNNAAHFLAGLDLPHSGSESLAESSAFATHRSQLDREWNDYTKSTLHPMSAWATSEVAPYSKSDGVLRYLFSGPDILHAFHVFPKVDTYVMCGLEPVGVAPNIDGLTPGTAGRALGEVRNALGEIINFSFFRTKDMKVDLQYGVFRGTTPIMMVFLARSGQYLLDYEFYELQSDGTLASQGADSKGANVVRIEFSPRRLKNNKTLYYFSTDLSNSGFTKNGFSKWLEAQPKGDSYLKAASFLMHSDWFGDVRDHLLDYSNVIVQTDSGIPYRHFDKDTWDIQLYGTYTRPIDLFAEYGQGDLRAAYGSGGVKKIDFGTGYKWRKGQSNLMRFVRKGVVPEATPVEEAPPATE